jgi:Tfp pilus assembly protein FimT
MKLHKQSRPAFTLVELLVAAGIIAMMLALVAISYPSINEREQLTRSVDKLRTGFLTARLWARRDNVVTGVKFDTPGTSFTYVQQPMEYIAGIVNAATSTTNLTIQITSSATPNFSKIKPNSIYNYSDDYIVLEGDVAHKITSALGSGLSGTLTIQSPFQINLISSGMSYNHPFRIIRGVEPIPLQEDTVLGDRISVASPVALPLNQILFLPSGQVSNAPASQIKFTITQDPLNPNDGPETADVFLDCLSGTTRYTNP